MKPKLIATRTKRFIGDVGMPLEHSGEATREECETIRGFMTYNNCVDSMNGREWVIWDYGYAIRRVRPQEYTWETRYYRVSVNFTEDDARRLLNS